MPLANALLVRYAFGYRLVEDAASIAALGRHEAFLSLGAIQSVDEVDRVGAALLGLSAFPNIATTAGIEPTGAGDNPFADFGVGDWITAPDETGVPSSQRVLGLSVTEDAEGNPLFAPELRSLADELDERLQRWLRRMSAGTLGGSSESASPASSTPAIGPSSTPTTRELVFYMGGTLSASSSGRYYPQRSGRATALVASLGVAGAAPVVFELRKNGVAVATVTIPAGSNGPVAVSLGATFLGPNVDYLSCAVTSAGGGAAELDVQVSTV